MLEMLQQTYGLYPYVAVNVDNVTWVDSSVVSCIGINFEITCVVNWNFVVIIVILDDNNKLHYYYH